MLHVCEGTNRAFTDAAISTTPVSGQACLNVYQSHGFIVKEPAVNSCYLLKTFGWDGTKSAKKKPLNCWATEIWILASVLFTIKQRVLKICKYLNLYSHFIHFGKYSCSIFHSELRVNPTRVSITNIYQNWSVNGFWKGFGNGLGMTELRNGSLSCCLEGGDKRINITANPDAEKEFTHISNHSPHPSTFPHDKLGNISVSKKSTLLLWEGTRNQGQGNRGQKEGNSKRDDGVETID